MSRLAKLERILQAWFEWENCSSAEKDQYRDAFHRLLDEARANSNVSRQEMIVALADRYREFRAVKEEKSGLDSRGCGEVFSVERPCIQDCHRVDRFSGTDVQLRHEVTERTEGRK